MKRIHFRMHESGSSVRTFCGLVVKRMHTKPFRRTTMGRALADSKVTCNGCYKTAVAWANHGLLKPPTLRRMSSFIVRVFGGVWQRHQSTGAEEALALLESAQLEGQRMGEAINKKYAAAVEAVTNAAAAIRNMERKLRLATTFLKKAKQRHARAEKKLAKTPQFTSEIPDEHDDNASETRDSGSDAAAVRPECEGLGEDQKGSSAGV